MLRDGEVPCRAANDGCELIPALGSPSTYFEPSEPSDSHENPVKTSGFHRTVHRTVGKNAPKPSDATVRLNGASSGRHARGNPLSVRIALSRRIRLNCGGRIAPLPERQLPTGIGVPCVHRASPDPLRERQLPADTVKGDRKSEGQFKMSSRGPKMSDESASGGDVRDESSGEGSRRNPIEAE